MKTQARKNHITYICTDIDQEKMSLLPYQAISTYFEQFPQYARMTHKHCQSVYCSACDCHFNVALCSHACKFAHKCIDIAFKCQCQKCIQLYDVQLAVCATQKKPQNQSISPWKTSTNVQMLRVTLKINGRVFLSFKIIFKKPLKML